MVYLVILWRNTLKNMVRSEMNKINRLVKLSIKKSKTVPSIKSNNFKVCCSVVNFIAKYFILSKVQYWNKYGNKIKNKIHWKTGITSPIPQHTLKYQKKFFFCHFSQANLPESCVIQWWFCLHLSLKQTSNKPHVSHVIFILC